MADNLFIKKVLIEKYYPGMTRIVLIRSSFWETYWYKERIGDVFLVRDFVDSKDFQEVFTCSDEEDDNSSNLFLVLSDLSGKQYEEGHIINKLDCDVIQ